MPRLQAGLLRLCRVERRPEATSNWSAIPRPKPSGDGQAQGFLKKLTPHVGKELSSDEMAKIVGAKSSNGLGPKMHQLRRVLADENVTLEDFVVRNKPDPAGPTSWKIVKAAA